ncbi:DUF2268 domain-containing putative Zn-dependent protease [Cytobacillus sp.]|uniref:DUF2268 domain-containing protein n=1 Tax=Cytobacillus sp. TaxID=2675269 RepID=UPI0028BEA040|nr:DUF2268 domain-containing putative Zn-dependent protease [Cytobacillus sp.]
MAGENFGVVRTDKWLEKNFDDPVKICQAFMESFGEEKPANIYNYLLGFGMYRPNRRTYEDYKKLIELKCWENVERIFRKYRREWNGPNVRVYIFPAAGSKSIFYRGRREKSGVAFTDKLFLFIPPIEDEKEIEALIVHEYHHTCRLIKQKKHVKDFTLLDSIVLEGLAEHAVAAYCGESYRAKWCDYYTRKEIIMYWKKFLQKNLDVKKHEKLHDEILFGHNGYPNMIGYAVGCEMINLYNEKYKLAAKDTFTLDSTLFLTVMKQVNN